MEKREECLFLVYGTLKRQYGNHHYLGDAEFKGVFLTKPEYTLFDGGYPIVEREGDTAIQGELYLSKDKHCIEAVFALEGCHSQIKGDKGNWYDFDYIDTPHGKAVMFVMDKDKSQRTKVLKNGIWN